MLVAARKRAAGIRLEVWDTGVGIPPAEFERIFQEFVQLGNTERDRRKGLGLGLSIARRSGALIGAVIDVRSRPGRGSCFGFAQAAAPAGEMVPAKADTRYRSLVRRADLPILIVDDDRDVRLALGDLLRRWGVRFDEAATGEAALAMVGAGAAYGLVLADFRLSGGMSGLELLSAIGAPQAGALITADFDPALIAAARDVGVPVIPKPVQPAQLRALLGL